MSDSFDTSGRPLDQGFRDYGRDQFRGERMRDQGGRGTGGEESIGSLLSGLLQDLQELLRGEIKLAKTEMSEQAKEAGAGIGMIAAGGIFGIVALTFLALAATYGLNTQLEMWLSALIVGVALAALAGILALVGKGRLSATNLKPDQTIASLKEDQEWAKQQMKSVKR